MSRVAMTEIIGKLKDERGKKVIFLSHCLLNENTRYAKKSWEQMILPGVMVNKKQLIESLKWLKQMSQESCCIEIIASHDSEIKPHSIEI